MKLIGRDILITVALHIRYRQYISAAEDMDRISQILISPGIRAGTQQSTCYEWSSKLSLIGRYGNMSRTTQLGILCTNTQSSPPALTRSRQGDFDLRPSYAWTYMILRNTKAILRNTMSHGSSDLCK